MASVFEIFKSAGKRGGWGGRLCMRVCVLIDANLLTKKAFDEIRAE